MEFQMPPVAINPHSLRQHLITAILHICGIRARSFQDVQAHYVSYFENEQGSPAVFVFNRATGEGALYLGRAGWNKAHAVVDGKVSGLALGDLEAIWLFNAWNTAMLLKSNKLHVVAEAQS